MEFNWTGRAAARAGQLIPSMSQEAVSNCLSKACVSVPADWRAAGGWQRKEFVLFWADSRPWVAIIELETRNLLSIIPAWVPTSGGGFGTELYEWIDGKKTVVCSVRRHQIRRAIRLLNDGTLIPPHFRNLEYSLSARVGLPSGKIRVFRLGKQTITEDVRVAMKEPEFLEQCRQKLFEIVPRHDVRHAVLVVSDGKYTEEIELVEQVCVGGW